MSSNYKVGVIGGGGWGTALSIIANRAGSTVKLGTRNANVVQSVHERRTNDIYLPSVFIDPNIQVTDKIGDVCRSDAIIIVVPANVLRSACIGISDMLDTKTPVIIASKGIERGSLLLMSEVVASILPKNPIGIISGPNFADEAARGLPAATTIASADNAVLDMLTYAIGGRLFRPYSTHDIIGAQIGGAVKNVIAIACGIAIGKKMGENARAALVTRGFTEMARLAVAKGGKYETLMGLSGLGDLLLTCGSAKSRNMSFGIAIGEGKSKDDILQGRGRSVTEGVTACESVTRLARKLGVSMPICDAVYRILYEAAPLEQTIADLIERPFASEGVTA
ncbi:MAG: NAD(P)H-dependent glycerol-3-phosphate dehydrogenase [Alphaproteobacteria bacterium]|nr:NAD(P)H-dependent glycerol-3-phosphate dehydrogenase [Alphaproteobacteria bacterium]